MNSRTFENVEQGSIDKFVGELGANATSEVVEEVTTYTILDHGFHATASYDAGAKSLKVDILGKPWIIPVEVIWNKLEYDLKNQEKGE